VLREGLHLTVVGLTVGCGLSLALATGLRSMLFGVTPTDTRTYVGVFTLLATASLAACYLPARRASRIDPMQALREE
jgi:putative ABC transport system permease protein